MAEDASGLQLEVRTVFFVVDSVSTSTVSECYVSLNNEFRNGNGVRISIQTVRNRLHEFGLIARRPAIRVPLTTQREQDRLDFARTHS